MANGGIQEARTKELTKEITEEQFLKDLYLFMKKRDTPIERIPNLGFKQSTYKYNSFYQILSVSECEKAVFFLFAFYMFYAPKHVKPTASVPLINSNSDFK